ncbi:hypothetical protein BDN72DRAFT_832360 [Pluteus cervinus]|uniref:Uncharacterized protein n=1 Tax=Pluteus cervinus TaxID=181527 RepID=A0ACD3BCY8_9AGAR|nr:hypothetical protein BDN72DRAFT_832360 [Pluteus cervinus]
MSSFSPASSTPTLTSSTSADTNEGKAPDAGPIADLPRIPTDDERKFQPKEGKRKEEKKRKADKESSRGSEQEKKRKRKERPESKLLSDVTSQVPGSIDAQEGGDPVGAPDEESQVSKAEKKLLSKEERKKIKAEKKARKREQANEL